MPRLAGTIASLAAGVPRAEKRLHDRFREDLAAFARLARVAGPTLAPVVEAVAPARVAIGRTTIEVELEVSRSTTSRLGVDLGVRSPEARRGLDHLHRLLHREETERTRRSFELAFDIERSVR